MLTLYLFGERAHTLCEVIATLAPSLVSGMQLEMDLSVMLEDSNPHHVFIVDVDFFQSASHALSPEALSRKPVIWLVNPQTWLNSPELLNLPHPVLIEGGVDESTLSRALSRAYQCTRQPLEKSRSLLNEVWVSNECFIDRLTQSCELAKVLKHQVVMVEFALAASDSTLHEMTDPQIEALVAGALKETLMPLESAVWFSDRHFRLLFPWVEDPVALFRRVLLIQRVLLSKTQLLFNEAFWQIGALIFPNDMENISQGLERLSKDTRKATKKQSFIASEQSMVHAAMERLNTEKSLQQCFMRNAFELSVLPFIHIKKGQTEYVQAQLRWQNQGDWEQVDESVIGILSDIGLYHSLLDWQLEHLSQAYSDWYQTYAVKISIIVSVQKEQLLSVDFTKRLNERLVKFGVEPHALVLKISEKALSHLKKSQEQPLMDLKKMGVRLWASDYGEEHMSIVRLHQLGFCGILLSQALSLDLDSSPEKAAYVRAIRVSASHFDMDVFAERVYYPRQVEVLMELGCSVMQADFLSPAVGIHEAEMADKILLRNWRQATEYSSLINMNEKNFYLP